VQRRDAKINEMRIHIDKIENELEQMKQAREQTQARLNNASESTTVCCALRVLNEGDLSFFLR
jgi:hypothetical protein